MTGVTQSALAGSEQSGSSSSKRVTIHFLDGATREIDVPDGTTILKAAHDNGIALASQCKIGTCCTCVASLTSGDARMSEVLITALTKEEIAAGQRLLCQSEALTDAEFHVEYPSALLEANPPVQFEAKIARLTPLAPNVMEVDVKLPKGMRFGFSAGQYCRIRVPGTDEWRSYSMASGEHEKGKLTFLIRLLPQGLMSDFLRDQARTGVSLEVEGPFGGFVLEPSSRPHLLIAGGTGLAPMLSMIDKLRLVRPAPPMLLVFGCVSEQDLFHLDELAARASFTPSLNVRVVLEHDTAIPGVLQGNPVSVLAQSDIEEQSVAYLCGPPGMIHAAQERLAAFGLVHDDIRSEQFLPS